MTEDTEPQPTPDLPSEPLTAVTKDLPAAAMRALAEAAERRKHAKPALPAELGGPKGLEPTRHGDWERKGIAVDF